MGEEFLFDVGLPSENSSPVLQKQTLSAQAVRPCSPAASEARGDPARVLVLFPVQASATVAIPKEHHRFVIGKNGEKLQDLELKTATKIQIPRPDDASNQIRITGTKEGIEKARHEVLLISAEQVRPRRP